MQLFAIISEVDIDGVSTDRRYVVELFLKQQLNQELVDEYLKVFDEFVESQTKKGANAKKKKRTSVNSVKILRICTQINEELAQPQKVVVLLRQIEFIFSEENPSEQEIEFVTTIAETFNISQEEYNRIYSFVKNKEDEVPESSKILMINDKEINNIPEIKHITIENLTGQLRILLVPSINMYLLRYYGGGEYYLNGQNINRDTVYVVNPGSSLRSSKIQPIYYSDIVSSFMSGKTADKIVYDVTDLEFRFPAGNIGIQSMNLKEESGRMIAIMGGSGAGKSTLLNVLNGVETPSSGQVLINGIDIHKDKEKAEGVIGFVPQDDLLMDDLTVLQNLYYSAKLCFGNFSDDKISEMCVSLLGDIGLFEAKDLKVGNPLQKVISGGQRKRLNIALELIREPSVLFLDEPTSGLSSRDSENIMDLLKELALKGKLIYVVIHQPSSDIFKMFDKLIILDVGGYIIYNGNPTDAVVYFKKLVQHINPDESECLQCGNVNPEQIFNIIESKIVDEYGNLTRTRKISPKQWNDYYMEEIEPIVQRQKVDTNSTIPKSTFKIPNKFKQIKVFITRDVLSKLANVQYMAITLLVMPVIAFAMAYFMKYFNTDISNEIGYIFRENPNIPTYMFASMVLLLFISLSLSGEEIIKDRKILKREKFLNLSKGGYLISKMSILFFISAIQTISLILVGNAILEIKGMTTDYWLVLFSTACFANLLGLNLSSAFNSAVTVYIIIPILLIPMLVFAGVMIKFDKLNPSIIVHNSVPMIGEIMVTRWAYEAMVVNQFKTNNFEKHFYKYDKEKSIADFKKNYWIPRLKSKVDDCVKNIGNPEKEQDVRNDLDLIRNELNLGVLPFKEISDIFPIALIDSIHYDSFNASIGKRLKIYLESLLHFYIKRRNNIARSKDKLVAQMNRDEVKRAKFLRIKNMYDNETLKDLVTNKNEINRIKEIDGELVQQADPIYLDQVDPGNIRAHFFAPRKRLFGKLYDTFWINIMVIWLMSIALMISLYFELFRKMIEYPGDLISKIQKLFSKKQVVEA